MKSGGNKSRYVSHIHHKICADLFGYFGNSLEVDDARISGSSGNDDLRLTGKSLLLKLVVIDIALFVNSVGDEVEIFTGQIYG